MDDLEKRLEDLLADPDSLKQLTELAGGLLGRDGDGHAASADADGKADGGGPDIASLLRVTEVASRLMGNNDDSQLLMALKPYLRSQRREKVDEAVKLMHILKLAPLIKEMNV